MPIETIAFKCSYCNKLSYTRKLSLEHERTCYRNPKLTFIKYIEEVETTAGIPAGSVKSKSRKQDIVDVRFIIAYKLREYGLSLNKVGIILNRNHATVIYAINRADELIKYDPYFNTLFEKLDKIKLYV